MRCKIIEIGPRDGFNTHDDIKKLCYKKGTLTRYNRPSGEWLQGTFLYDGLGITENRQNELVFFQIKVQVLEPWGKVTNEP